MAGFKFDGDEYNVNIALSDVTGEEIIVTVHPEYVATFMALSASEFSVKLRSGSPEVRSMDSASFS